MFGYDQFMPNPVPMDNDIFWDRGQLLFDQSTTLSSPKFFLLINNMISLIHWFRFLPALAKESLSKMLEKGGIEKDFIEEDPTIKCIVENNMLTIGKIFIVNFKYDNIIQRDFIFSIAWTTTYHYVAWI